MSDKITARHLDRKAIVYVRQSSHQQLMHNTEGRRLQYAMEQRVRKLGWLETEVIDEDLGRSATSTSGTGRKRSCASFRPRTSISVMKSRSSMITGKSSK